MTPNVIFWTHCSIFYVKAKDGDIASSLAATIAQMSANTAELGKFDIWDTCHYIRWNWHEYILQYCVWYSNCQHSWAGMFDMFISICFGGILVFKVIGIGWIHFTILCVVLKQSMNRKTTFRGGTTGNVCQPGSGWWWVGLSTSKPFSPSISLKIHTYSPSANVSLSTVFG